MKSKEVFKHLAKGGQVQYRLKNGAKSWRLGHLLTVEEINNKKHDDIKIEFRKLDFDKIEFEKSYVYLFGETVFDAEYDEQMELNFKIWKFGTVQKFLTFSRDQKTLFKTFMYVPMELEVTRKIIESFTKKFGRNTVWSGPDKTCFKCRNFTNAAGRNSIAVFENIENGRRLEFIDDQNSREFMIYIDAVFRRGRLE